MATTKIRKKDMQQDEFIETVFDFGDWLEVHWRRVAIGAGVALGIFFVGYAWFAMRENAAAEANDLLAQGLAAFSPAPGATGAAPAPDYNVALPLFEQAAAKAGGQPIGAVARLYRGRTLIALGRATEAAPILEALASSGNKRLAAQAKVSLADVAVAAKNYDRAATLLQEVSSTLADAYPPDAALMQLAGVREAQGKKGEAKQVYDDLIARYPEGAYAADARQRASDLGASRGTEPASSTSGP